MYNSYFLFLNRKPAKMHDFPNAKHFKLKSKLVPAAYGTNTKGF
jgi:hypothetical protein